MVLCGTGFSTCLGGSVLRFVLLFCLVGGVCGPVLHGRVMHLWLGGAVLAIVGFAVHGGALGLARLCYLSWEVLVHGV